MLSKGHTVTRSLLPFAAQLSLLMPGHKDMETRQSESEGRYRAEKAAHSRKYRVLVYLSVQFSANASYTSRRNAQMRGGEKTGASGSDGLHNSIIIRRVHPIRQDYELTQDKGS